MADIDPTRTRGVLARVRRRWGFTVFCVLMGALITALVLSPLYPRPAAAARPGKRGTHGLARAPRGRIAEFRDPSVARIRTVLQRIALTGQPVYCGGGTRPLVALTFDDGPGPYTQRTLELLRRRGMTATFFLVGKLLGEGRFAWLPHAEAVLGTVGDHTWDHIPVVGLSASGLRAQIARTRAAVAQAAGAPVRLFRPPLGQHDTTVDGYVRSLGMVEVLWSLDSQDSLGASADRIVRNVRRHLAAGDIVLLHENRGTTQRALPRILQIVQAEGLRAVTVPQLLALDPPSPDQLRGHTCPG